MVSARQRLHGAIPKHCQSSERVSPRTLLDNEIVAIDETGRISFNLLQHHRSQAQALLFYAFDVLIHRGINLLSEPLSTRREVLSDFMKPVVRTASAVSLSESIDATPAELIRVVNEFGFEGVIAKRKDSFYESGKRSGAWLKYKVNKSQEFVIGGYTPGYLCFAARLIPNRSCSIVDRKRPPSQIEMSGLKVLLKAFPSCRRRAKTN